MKSRAGRVVFLSATVAAVVAGAWIAVGGTAAGGLIPGLFQESYALEAKGENGRAIEKAKEILSHAPKDYVAVLRLGWLSYLDGAYEASEKAYREAVALEPAAIEPRLGLLLPLMANHRNKEAIAVADEILAKDPLNYLARSRRAFALYLSGRHAEAHDEYAAILALYPSDVEMMAGLGWSLLRQGKCKEATAVFERLLRIAPKHITGGDGLAACRAQ